MFLRSWRHILHTMISAVGPTGARTRRQSRRRQRAVCHCQIETLETRTLLSTATLDPTFGHNGVVTADYPPVNGSYGGMTTLFQTDDRIIVFRSTSGVGGTFGIERYLLDGTPDTTFDGDGIVTASINGWPKGAAVQPDGKVIVVGGGSLIRFNADGTLDATFGSAGTATVSFGDLSAALSSVIVQSDGRIVAAGAAQPATNTRASLFALTRFDNAGNLDPSFGTLGKVLTAIRDSAAGAALMVQADGRIVVAGTSTIRDGDGQPLDDFAVARYNADGSLDSTFDGDGIQITSFAAANVDPGNRTRSARADGLLLQPDGKLVVAGATGGHYWGGGTSGYPLDISSVLARYNADGSLDTTFGDQGRLATAGIYASATSIALESNGSILVSGYTPLEEATGLHRGLVCTRINADGTPLATMTDRETLPGGFNFYGGSSIAVQPDGRLLFAGGRSVVRYEPTAAPTIQLLLPQPCVYCPEPEIQSSDSNVTVQATHSLNSGEDGTTALFDIVLTTRPSSDVVIPLGSSRPEEGFPSPNTLTFTPDNWFTPQRVTAASVDDLPVDGDQTYTIIIGAAQSSDADYGGVNPDDVPVTSRDNDRIQMHRAYNLNAGLHFFTTSGPEFNTVVYGVPNLDWRGWVFGVSILSFPVIEKDFRNESGTAGDFAVARNHDPGSNAIHRLYDPHSGVHYLTASDFERDHLVGLGWNFERDEGYIFDTATPDTVEVFHLYNQLTGAHLFTIDASERDGDLRLFPGIWVSQASLGYAFTVPPPVFSCYGGCAMTATEISATTVANASVGASSKMPVAFAATRQNTIAADSGIPLGFRPEDAAQFAPNQTVEPSSVDSIEPASTPLSRVAVSPRSSRDAAWEEIARQIGEGLHDPLDVR